MSYNRYYQPKKYRTQDPPVFYVPELPGPEARKQGWYYFDKKQYPIGPFSSSTDATYAWHRNLPAPAEIGKVSDHYTY